MRASVSGPVMAIFRRSPYTLKASHLYAPNMLLLWTLGLVYMATGGRLERLPQHVASQLCNLITRVAGADTAALMRQLASTFLKLGSISAPQHTNSSIKDRP